MCGWRWWGVVNILSPFTSVILELYRENLPLSNWNLSYSKGIMRGKSRAEEEREVVVPPFIFPSAVRAGRNRSYRHYTIWLVPDVCFPVTLPTHSCPLHTILSPLRLLPDNVVRWSPDEWRETERMDLRKNFLISDFWVYLVEDIKLQSPDLSWFKSNNLYFG